MRIYQFENSNQNRDKDICLMFLIGDNDYIKSATSFADYGRNKEFNWTSRWEWLVESHIVNTFKYKDDL